MPSKIVIALVIFFCLGFITSSNKKLAAPSVTIRNTGNFVKHSIIKKVYFDTQLFNTGNQPLSMVSFTYQCYLSRDIVFSQQSDKSAGGAIINLQNETIASGAASTVKRLSFSYGETNLALYPYLIIRLFWRNTNGQNERITTASKVYNFENQADLELTATNENVYIITNIGSKKAVFTHNTTLQRYKVTDCNNTIPNNMPANGMTILAGTEINPGQSKSFTIGGFIGDNPSRKVKAHITYYSGPDLQSSNNEVCVSY